MLDILEKVQLVAARLVTGATRRCPTNTLYSEVGWEKLSSRREFHRGSLMFKIQNNQAPTYLQDLIPEPIEARTRYNLRNRNDLQVPFARLETYSQSFFPAAARLWNSLRPSIRQASTIFSFKNRYLKDFPRPKTNRLHYYGKRHINIAMAKMRIGCSFLNYDLCNNLHVIQDQNCPCLMGIPETAEQFLTVCPWYMIHRIEMYAKLFDIQNLPTINVELLLNGDPTLDYTTNLSIVTIVHHFISQTSRFDS
jgi:hypothetical protein